MDQHSCTSSTLIIEWQTIYRSRTNHIGISPCLHEQSFDYLVLRHQGRHWDWAYVCTFPSVSVFLTETCLTSVHFILIHVINPTKKQAYTGGITSTLIAYQKEKQIIVSGGSIVCSQGSPPTSIHHHCVINNLT